MPLANYNNNNNINKMKILLLQKFEILFKHSPKYVYFEHKQANYINKFLKNKSINITEYTFRRQV